MATAKEILKGWFSNFKKPTQNQFWAWIESYWHKDEKIPIDSVEGLKSALENTANADMINNHLTDTQAHKALFDKKVNKEDGKGLSSNDYTDEEKARNAENEKWRAVGMSVTGEANKTITLTFNNGEVLTAPFVDIAGGGGAGPDVKLNSLAFDPTTGVLTGNRSDGTPITVNLDGRYALLSHTHKITDIEGLEASLNALPNQYQLNQKADKSTVSKLEESLNGIMVAADGGNGSYFKRGIEVKYKKETASTDIRAILFKNSATIKATAIVENEKLNQPTFSITLDLQESIKQKLNNSGSGGGSSQPNVVEIHPGDTITEAHNGAFLLYDNEYSDALIRIECDKINKPIHFRIQSNVYRNVSFVIIGAKDKVFRNNVEMISGQGSYADVTITRNKDVLVNINNVS